MNRKKAKLTSRRRNWSSDEMLMKEYPRLVSKATECHFVPAFLCVRATPVMFPQLGQCETDEPSQVCARQPGYAPLTLVIGP
jgi:hypothetical protein